MNLAKSNLFHDDADLQARLDHRINVPIALGKLKLEVFGVMGIDHDDSILFLELVLGHEGTQF